MLLAQYRARRGIVVMSVAILSLTIAALDLAWVQSHAQFRQDDLYWVLD